MASWFSKPHNTERPIYHIRVQGSLDAKWADWFEGFTMLPRADGVTLLSGAVADQAALHGVLGKINSLGLPLLLVAKVNCPCPSTGCAKRGLCTECMAYEASRGALPFCFRANTRWDRLCCDLK